MFRYSGLIAAVVFGAILVSTSAGNADQGKTIIFIAGKKSHGYGGHEHYAGCMLLAKKIKEAYPSVKTKVFQNGWPQETGALDDADAIVLFSDGGGRNPINAHLDEVQTLMKQGVGLACLHYAVEVPKGKPGDCLKDWIGGYFETFWSVNPHFIAEFKKFPNHAIARGVKPFSIDDEWYYHMRFVDDMKDVTPILTAIPPDSTRDRKDGAHSNNPTVRARKGMPEHVAWARERADGGRGFGFTGGHWHWNWANDSFRKVTLNGIAWIARLEIPSGGVESTTPTWAELEQHQDYEKPGKFDQDFWLKAIERWNSR